MPLLHIAANIADLLRGVGYATGAFGKWHLGDDPQFLPLQQGFDEYLGLPYSNDMWPVDYDGTPATSGNKLRWPPLPLIEGNEVLEIVDELADQGRLRRLAALDLAAGEFPQASQVTAFEALGDEKFLLVKNQSGSDVDGLNGQCSCR